MRFPAGMRGVRLLPLVAVVAATLAGARQSTHLDLSTKAITNRAAAYVADYQTKFAFLVADETYIQTVTRDDTVRRRVMHGELFLTFLRTDREWIAVHDVADVDGVPVPDRDNLQTLLQRADVTSVAQRVANRNALFNIGSVSRNFNEPTLALLVLEAKRVSQFKFDRNAVIDHDGTTAATLDFVEHNGPTLVKGPSTSPIYSKGEITVDAATGRVEHTVITFRDKAVDATLTTAYASEDRLGLWVPGTFSERYVLKNGKITEVTVCTATYTNYRRFEVTGRIKGR